MQGINSKQVLMWPQRVKAQRVQKKALDNMKSAKDFDHMQKIK